MWKSELPKSKAQLSSVVCQGTALSWRQAPTSSQWCVLLLLQANMVVHCAGCHDNTIERCVLSVHVIQTAGEALDPQHKQQQHKQAQEEAMHNVQV